MSFILFYFIFFLQQEYKCNVHVQYIRRQRVYAGYIEESRAVPPGAGVRCLWEKAGVGSSDDLSGMLFLMSGSAWVRRRLL